MQSYSRCILKDILFTLLAVVITAGTACADFVVTDTTGGSIQRYTNAGEQLWSIGNGRSGSGMTLNQAGALITYARQGTDRMLTTFGIDGTYYDKRYNSGAQTVDSAWLTVDLNGDGRVELVVTTRDSMDIVSVNDTDIANTTFTTLASYLVADTNGSNGTGGKLLLGADYNGDGVRDIVATKGGNASGNRINIWNPLDGTQIASYPAEECRGIGDAIFGKDQNGDGVEDLWVCNPYRNQITAYDIANGGAYLGNVNLGATINSPQGLVEDGDGFVYISTRFGSSLSVGGAGSAYGNVIKYDPATATTTLILDVANAYYSSICYIPTKYASNPSPGTEKKVGIGWPTLSWNNPEPNLPGGEIRCDVYFTDNYPQAGMIMGDPNFTTYATKILDNQPVNSMTMPALVALKNYYWRVDVRDSSSASAGTRIGEVWRFATVDNFAPVVDAGAAVATWLTDGTATVQMAPVITDDGQPDPPSATTVLWEVTPQDPAVVIDSPASETTTVTITAAGTYTLTLTANDGEKTNSDTVTITVYATACEHAQAQPGYMALLGDLNNDCEVDMSDFAQFAGNWLGSSASK